MLIRVMYSDGKFDMVGQLMLDQLLEFGRVASFKRSGGWAVVGRDTLRGSGGMSYHGTERRNR